MRTTKSKLVPYKLTKCHSQIEVLIKKFDDSPFLDQKDEDDFLPNSEPVNNWQKISESEIKCDLIVDGYQKVGTDDIIYIIDESPLRNIGVTSYAVFSDNKESLLAFIKDQNLQDFLLQVPGVASQTI